MKIRPLFNKYQNYLLAFVNTKFGRSYLDIKRQSRIYMISPDSIHYMEDNVCQADFFPRSPYLKKFRLALEGMAIVEEAGLSLGKFLKEKTEFIIPHFQDLIAPKAYLPLLFRTVSDFYPDGDPETTSVDGVLYYEIASSFANWRVQATASTVDSSSQFFADGGPCVGKHGDTDYRGGRVMYLFDTSSMGLGAKIDTGTPPTFAFTIHDSETNYNLCLCQSTPASNTNLVAADFGIGNFSSSEGATRVSSGTTANVTKTFTLDATGQGWIDVSGITKLAIRDYQDVDNSAPTVTNRRGVYFFESTTAAYRPKLQITYTPASRGNAIMFNGGVAIA